MFFGFIRVYTVVFSDPFTGSKSDIFLLVEYLEENYPELENVTLFLIV